MKIFRKNSRLLFAMTLAFCFLLARDTYSPKVGENTGDQPTTELSNKA